MTFQMIQKLILTVVLILIIIGVVGYQISLMQRQSYAEEVAYVVTLLKQAGDFIRTHTAHGGQARFGSQLQFGVIKRVQQGMCLIRFDVGGGNIITLYQSSYSYLQYQTPHALYGETWIFDRGDTVRAHAGTPDEADAVFHYSAGGITYVILRTATYVAATKTQGAVNVNVYVFQFKSPGTGGSGTFTLSTQTETIIEHLRFMPSTGSTVLTLYAQTGTDARGLPLEEQIPLPSLNPGDLVDVSVSLVTVTIAW